MTKKGTKVQATKVYGARLSGLVAEYAHQVGRIQRFKPHKWLNIVVEYPDGFRLSYHRSHLKYAQKGRA